MDDRNVAGELASELAGDWAAAGEREVVELHEFFKGWYRGELDQADFARFDQALVDGFVIIMPGGQVLGRAVIVEAVRDQYDSHPDVELWIDNVALHQVHENTAVFTYEEWQGRGGEPARGRLSTVVFAADDDAPNGLVWLHVHETWLPDQH